MTFSLTSLAVCLPQTPKDTCDATWWIALSGGLDSCVLLHALAALHLPVRLHALHVNHQISPNATLWQQHCAELCAQLGVAYTAVKVKVTNKGRGIEDAAREARYGVFEHYLKPGDYLFTAHHADDQAETLLLRLMRGAGPRGLASMAKQRSLGQGVLCRPLLGFTRAELTHYAQAQGLCWVDDESNTDNHYDRNYLRNQVMPLLRERWPQFAQKWQQTIDLCADSEAIVDELAAQDCQLAGFRHELIGTSISLDYVRALSVSRRNNLLRHWLRSQKLSLPERQHFEQIEAQIICGRQDAETQVNWSELSLRVFKQRVFALPLGELSLGANPQEVIPVNLLSERVILPVGGSLVFSFCSQPKGRLLNPDLPNLNIRYRQGGERCQPAGRQHSQTLKRLLQEYQVAPWMREILPLIYSGDQLVAVGDLWICEGFQVENNGYLVKSAPR